MNTSWDALCIIAVKLIIGTDNGLVSVNTDIVMPQAYKTYNVYRFIDTLGPTVLPF